MEHGILLHSVKDDVGVAVRDLAAGSEVGTVTLEGEVVGSIEIVGDVPLGHKVAMRAIPAGKEIIEYENPIGSATQDISAGDHIHVHNIKTLRW